MNEGVDLGTLQNLLEPKRETRFAKEQHGHKFVKAIADLFRKNDEDGLWRIEASEDGKEYFVRSELSDPEAIVQSSTGPWTMTTDKANENVTLAYKSIPVKKFAASEFKFADPVKFSARIASQFDTLAFRRHIMAELGPATKELLQKQAPEFLKLS